MKRGDSVKASAHMVDLPSVVCSQVSAFPKKVESSAQRRRVLLAACFLVFYPVVLLFAAVLPDIWLDFSVSGGSS
jgi:hypothetical protein